MRRLLLFLTVFNSLLLASLVKNGDIVKDSVTNLMWQDSNNTSIQKSWIDAINYCENLTLGGYSDWRLPNIVELESIIDRNKINFALSSIFENVSFNLYWSSTTYSHDTTSAWVVDFYDGSNAISSKDNNNSVKCVRGGN